MGLILPQPPNWGYYANNLPSTVSTAATGLGTSVTAGASNVKGTPVSLLTVSRDVELLRIGFGNFAAAGANCSALADILIDPAGGTSWEVRVPNLFAGATFSSAMATVDATPPWRWFDIPIWIPAGAAIGCQIANARAATTTGEVLLMVAGGNANPGSWWCGQSVEAIGINTADSGGAAHTAGNTSAFSSWANFGSTLSRDAKAVMFATMGEGDAAYSNLSYIFEFGVGSEIIGSPVYFSTDSTNETELPFLMQGVNFRSLAAGTQLMTRGKCSGTAVAIDVGAWAIS